ncbi:hypothetical protein GCM10011425_01800 [Mucilaginibacter galii]|uniref:Uncharacterized protein n=2 Tax=Mucilaginibacter galii TaxID=2005073 RepID=A0A917J4M8_9SPHI|nr:hypothetical protein GCM10011425_01800 [Mucilaginibacter galii]
MDKVISQADCFVLARVKSVDADKGITINVIKTIGGEKVSGDIKVSGFYLLHLCSTSAGEGPEFHFKGIDSCYFFLKKNKGEQYAIATPTTGFAWVKNGIVAGTYRHSYHQARTTANVYEPTMQAIFNNYHNLPYDTKYINDFVTKNLATKPAGPTPDEMQNFYNQHIALECIYHLRLKGYEKQLAVFVKANYSFHAQASAARALIAYNTSQSKSELMGLVADKETSDFIKVIALWTLESYKPVELKTQLVALSKKASTEENGFGGDIMDSRVCTHMPTVKEAIDTLIKTI